MSFDRMDLILLN